MPTVEVRYENLCVDAECEVVHGKPLPTLLNTLKSTISVSLLTCRSDFHIYYLIQSLTLWIPKWRRESKNKYLTCILYPVVVITLGTSLQNDLWSYVVSTSMLDGHFVFVIFTDSSFG